MVTLAGIGAVSFLGLPAGAQTQAKPVSATAITQVFGDGVRFVAVALEFDDTIDADALSNDDFSVADRTVTDAYTATSTDPADKADSGRFVIVTLSPEDEGAILAEQSENKGGGGPGGSGDAGGPGGPGGPGKGGPGKAGDPATADSTWREPVATVTQAAFEAADGETVAAARIETSAVRNLVVDDFKQLEYTDPETGDTLAYNLFVPRGYDPSKSYPLVNFMHDAGATSKNPRTTLLQGLGAISWASPEDQAKRPCFVLAPQYDEIIADDDSRTSSMLDTTINLIKSLAKDYNIDTDRLYTTGQSGGCMMSIAMNIAYPDFFAASLLVAGQWDPALVAPMANDKLWIVVSQDDDKAFPGENAITEKLEAQGATVSRAVWDGTWSNEQFQFAFDDLDAEASPINYVCFAAGTVIPEGESTAGASGHRNTWRIAYSIEPLREWIFRHSRLQ
ncbi:PHB depolymerase family esterase [Jiella sonneratiae]|uniref:Esterase Ig-like N-terminal domain-containing protein n=1 Tax=Jiella sonneratiae TaxID=2816856 RepID=A0ABS3J6M0_9HYPH|nr:PHB depolymerase family esterase [Jiella sonneratiae]MBO0904241.1 hypothetical protein [Jiella sonneratiae]